MSMLTSTQSTRSSSGSGASDTFSSKIGSATIPSPTNNKPNLSARTHKQRLIDLSPHINLEVQFAKAIDDLRSTDWQSQTDALSIIQSVADNDIDLLKTVINAPTRELIRGVLGCVTSLRSGVAKKGVDVINLILKAVADSPRINRSLEIIVPVLVSKITSEKKFMAEGALTCLMNAADVPRVGFQTQYLSCLGKFMTHSNSSIVAQVSHIIATITENLGSINGLTPPFIKANLLPWVGRMLIERLPLAKKSGRDILKIIATYLETQQCERGAESRTRTLTPNLSSLLQSYLRQALDIPSAERIALERAISQDQTALVGKLDGVARRPPRPTPPTARSANVSSAAVRSRTLPPPMKEHGRDTSSHGEAPKSSTDMADVSSFISQKTACTVGAQREQSPVPRRLASRAPQRAPSPTPFRALGFGSQKGLSPVPAIRAVSPAPQNALGPLCHRAPSPVPQRNIKVPELTQQIQQIVNKPGVAPYKLRSNSVALASSSLSSILNNLDAKEKQPTANGNARPIAAVQSYSPKSAPNRKEFSPSCSSSSSNNTSPIPPDISNRPMQQYVLNVEGSGIATKYLSANAPKTATEFSFPQTFPLEFSSLHKGFHSSRGPMETRLPNAPFSNGITSARDQYHLRSTNRELKQPFSSSLSLSAQAPAQPVLQQVPIIGRNAIRSRFPFQGTLSTASSTTICCDNSLTPSACSPPALPQSNGRASPTGQDAFDDYRFFCTQ